MQSGLDVILLVAAAHLRQRQEGIFRRMSLKIDTFLTVGVQLSKTE